ncbi:ArsI/CadI family heavy metal resistance metalloenzyme [Alkalicoccobacillus porphyridii]|uniref:Glyoxalase/bleomycin resistance/dioxygenase family protein n=1 Tax=Alkalicoccobacillus porphyridii TaxID=2597270 RepID=A0A553ZWW5_9BACI|nr:ArsI/CadI family heavy metal resistance metalloenzyme [Alkalicoccobacillus porphyridii]TSB45947.1 glyoxalase/bleomycin resistance/dioxygenase family protein [Alkalicoccobacillus porphyridii]
MTYVHIGINVENLAESKQFYERFLGLQPVKEKEDYVKFLSEEPALNLTLREVANVGGNQVNHLGVQVTAKEEIGRHKQRIEQMGIHIREEMNTTCCYAVQDKFWVRDPNGIEWEYFYTKEDVE